MAGNQETLGRFLPGVVQLVMEQLWAAVSLAACLPQDLGAWGPGLPSPQLDSRSTKTVSPHGSPGVGDEASAASFCVVTSTHFRASIACQSRVVADAIRVFRSLRHVFYSSSLCLPDIGNMLGFSAAPGKMRKLLLLFHHLQKVQYRLSFYGGSAPGNSCVSF